MQDEKAADSKEVTRIKSHNGQIDDNHAEATIWSASVVSNGLDQPSMKKSRREQKKARKAKKARQSKQMKSNDFR
jgi:hypothetical protein